VKVRITVGNVQIDTKGVDLTKADIKALAKLAATLADSGDTAPVAEEEPQAAFGFTAHIERVQEVILTEDLSEYFDD
jgi:hypothetical protein